MAAALLSSFLLVLVAASSRRLGSAAALVGETCSSSSSSSSSSFSSCGGSGGLRCTSCVPPPGTGPATCARTTPVDPKAALGTGLPFNRYSWLTTHNSFAAVGTRSPIGSAIISPPNQEDGVTSQLNHGVRGLMLDAYDFNNDVWLCHSFNGKCFAFTAYVPALSVLKEIQAFLESNPSEVITIFVEDYTAPGSLAEALAAAGLTKYLFPADKMPSKENENWPVLRDMIGQNHRLVVFTSKKGKEASDGLPYLWNYVVETQYGSDGLAQGRCASRAESRPMDSKAQALVLVNFFTTNPSQSWACGNNSSPLVNKLEACYRASANRWPNFIAVDFYMRSNGGGAPLATDVANGRLQCGCDTIAYCRPNAPFGACSMSMSSSPSPSPAAAAAAAPKISASPAAAPAPSPMTMSLLGPSSASSSSSRREASEKEAATAREGPNAAAHISSSSSISRRRPWSSSSLLILSPLLLVLL